MDEAFWEEAGLPIPVVPSEFARPLRVQREFAWTNTREKMPVFCEVLDTESPFDAARLCMDAEMVEAASKIANKSKAFFADCPPQEVAVYVIAPAQGAYSKIGVANNPASRLKGLQTAHFDKLVVHALFWCQTMQAAYALETKAHKAAEVFARRGEWFATDPVTAALIVAEAAIKAEMPVSSSAMWLRHRQLVRQQLRLINYGSEPDDELRVVA